MAHASPLIPNPKDAALFVEMCETYQNDMYRTARAILTGKYARHIDDAVQDACISLAKNILLIKNKIPCSKRRSFIVRVVKNKAIDIIRHENKRAADSLEGLEFMAGTQEEDPLEVFIEKEGHQRVLSAINELEEIYRSVLAFKLLDGLSDVEIANVLNITPKNVNVRTFRAKKKLREVLQKEQ